MSEAVTIVGLLVLAACIWWLAEQIDKAARGVLIPNHPPEDDESGIPKP